MIKTLTANQNPPDFKEFENLKQQTTKLQLAILIAICPLVKFNDNIAMIVTLLLKMSAYIVGEKQYVKRVEYPNLVFIIS